MLHCFSNLEIFRSREVAEQRSAFSFILAKVTMLEGARARILLIRWPLQQILLKLYTCTFKMTL